MQMFFGYYFLTFFIFIVFLFRLTCEINSFIRTYGTKIEYNQFINRLCFYYVAITITFISIAYNILITFYVEDIKGKSKEWKDIWRLCGFISEQLVILIYI